MEQAEGAVRSNENLALETGGQGHWDSVYEKSDVSGLGWYENSPQPSLELIHSCSLDPRAAILNVGAGATTLVDELLKAGYQNLIANDISPVALDKLKQRLGEDQKRVSWIADDLTRPVNLSLLEGEVDLWHDRAVLHFFMEEEDQDTYFKLLKKLVRPGGYVILAAFNLNGATKCSGLPVRRYDQSMLSEKLGADFKLLNAFDFTYTQPSGNTREYIYTLFQRL